MLRDFLKTKEMKAAVALAFLGLLSAALMVFLLPHERKVSSLAIFLLKLLPFCICAVSIALLDAKLFSRTATTLLLMLPFLLIFCYFVPKIFFYLDDFPEVYYHVLMLVPTIILSLELAYKLGGGGFSGSLRLAFALLVIMVSGIEDLAFLTVNKHTDPAWAKIPDVWTWASHMKVRLGFYPTKYQAFAFIAAHLALAVFIAVFPFGKARDFVKAKLAKSKR